MTLITFRRKRGLVFFFCFFFLLVIDRCKCLRSMLTHATANRTGEKHFRSCPYTLEIVCSLASVTGKWAWPLLFCLPAIDPAHLKSIMLAHLLPVSASASPPACRLKVQLVFQIFRPKSESHLCIFTLVSVLCCFPACPTHPLSFCLALAQVQTQYQTQTSLCKQTLRENLASALCKWNYCVCADPER